MLCRIIQPEEINVPLHVRRTGSLPGATLAPKQCPRMNYLRKPQQITKDVDAPYCTLKRSVSLSRICGRTYQPLCIPLRLLFNWLIIWPREAVSRGRRLIFLKRSSRGWVGRVVGWLPSSYSLPISCAQLHLHNLHLKIWKLSTACLLKHKSPIASKQITPQTSTLRQYSLSSAEIHP